MKIKYLLLLAVLLLGAFVGGCNKEDPATTEPKTDTSVSSSGTSKAPPTNGGTLPRPPK